MCPLIYQTADLQKGENERNNCKLMKQCATLDGKTASNLKINTRNTVKFSLRVVDISSAGVLAGVVGGDVVVSSVKHTICTVSMHTLRIVPPPSLEYNIKNC